MSKIEVLKYKVPNNNEILLETNDFDVVRLTTDAGETIDISFDHNSTNIIRVRCGASGGYTNLTVFPASGNGIDITVVDNEVRYR